MVTRSLALLLACGTTGCSLITDSFATNDFSGDEYPIFVDARSGAVLVGLRTGEGDLRAVLDVLSPVTLVDPGVTAAPSVYSSDLVLLGERAAGSFGAPDLPRARFDSARVISLHPCKDDDCSVGPASAPELYNAIVGADMLAGDALRLRLGDDRMFLLADVAGTESDRSATCDAVFPSPYRGGGTLLIAGTEVSFSGRRITLQACLSADPDPNLVQSQRGADVLLVMSTSIGVSLLGTSAYERYRTIRPTSPPLATLPDEIVHLPSGPIAGKRVTIDNLAMVARSGSAPRAPCRQVFAHHLIADHDCFPFDDCPCEGNDTFCVVPASVELAPPGGLDMLVIGDDEGVLQALRTELRPDQPEIDGILGTDALRDVELDVDYPHNRVLVRCTTTACEVRSAIDERADRDTVARCAP